MVRATKVVAALIWDGQRFLICQRPAHKAQGMLWEFVGGKVEKGETKQQALMREAQEELGVELVVGELFIQVDHLYPELLVELFLYQATIKSGKPQKLEHHDMRWITVQQIKDFDFCPANQEILEKIQQVYGKR